jgi:hypothetical protein
VTVWAVYVYWSAENAIIISFLINKEARHEGAFLRIKRK